MSDNIALYNCDPWCWRQDAVGEKVLLQDGMLQRMTGPDISDWVARFRNDDHAKQVLQETGWKNIHDNVWEKVSKD